MLVKGHIIRGWKDSEDRKWLEISLASLANRDWMRKLASDPKMQTQFGVSRISRIGVTLIIKWVGRQRGRARHAILIDQSAYGGG